MSEYRIHRRGSSRRSSRKGRSRRASVRSMGSYGTRDDEEEELLKMLEQEYQKGIERNNSKKRKEKRRSVDFEDGENEEDDDDDNEGEGEGEEEEEEIDQEELLAKIQHCKELIEGVKRQTWKMSKKLQVHKNARAYVEHFEGKLSRSKGYQQRGRELMKRLERSWNNFAASLVPWEMKIKRIESHFGSVVASYFTFLRWLLWVSVWLAVMPTCFIIVPEMLVGSTPDPDTRKQVPEEGKEIAADLNTIWNAEGIVQYSPIFYGYYGNADKIGQGYRLPLAYLVTGLAAFAFSFIVVLKTMAANSRQSRMSESSDEEYIFAWKLFTEWDYMIASNETATTKHASITTTFKESILEEQEKAREGNKYLQISLRVTANVIILILLATSTYVIQLFVERSRQLDINKRNNPGFEPGFWDANELTIIMTLISTIFPNILDLVSLMEKYHPRTSLRLMLARIFVLNLLNLYTLFIALYNKQTDLLASLEEYQTNRTVTNNCSSLITVTDAPLEQSTELVFSKSSDAFNSTGCADIVTVEESIASLCWETMIGQEVFKLTVTDLVFVVGQILLIDVFRTYFIKYANCLCCWDMEKTFPEYPDFKTAENLLHLINNQGTIWLGSFFAPGLPLLNLLKLIIMVYLRCWVVLSYNAPQERIFRASRSNNFYFSLLLIMLFLCMLPPLFAIVAVEPSPYCGPFSGSNRIFHVITRTMTQELPESVNVVIEYAASPGVILPIFMLLGMTIYYLLSVGRSLRDVNNDLKSQLEYERTEGRRKVYAMADAKHEAAQKAKGKGWVAAKSKLLPSQKGAAGGKKNMATTVLQALRASKAISEGGKKNLPVVAPKPGRAAGRGGNQGGGDGGEGGEEGVSKRTLSLLERLREAQRIQTSVPVAVIEGKQSVKATRDRDPNDVKSLFRKRLLEHARSQKQISTEADNTTERNRDRENQQNYSQRPQTRRADIDIERSNRRNGKYVNRITRRKGFRRNEGDSEIETLPADVPSRKQQRQNGRDAPTRNRRFNSNDRFGERRTRAEVHNVSIKQRTDKGRSKSNGRNFNVKSEKVENVVNRSRSMSPRPVEVKPKKQLLRRVSSSSMVDENGHLKPYDENNDDDDDDSDEDDDEEEKDFSGVSSDDVEDDLDDSIDDDDDEDERDAIPYDDDDNVHSEMSEENEEDASSDGNDDDDVFNGSNSEDDNANEIHLSRGRRNLPFSKAVEKSKHKELYQSGRHFNSKPNSPQKDRGKIQIDSQRSKKPSAHLEIVDESTTGKLRNTGRKSQSFLNERTSNENDGPTVKERSSKDDVKTLGTGKETKVAKNTQKQHAKQVKLQRASNKDSSSGQVPKITVEDYSGKTSPSNPDIQESQNNSSRKRDAVSTSGRSPSNKGKEISSEGKGGKGKSSEQKTVHEKVASPKDKDSKPSWLSMKLKPVNKDKKENSSAPSKSDIPANTNKDGGTSSHDNSTATSGGHKNTGKSKPINGQVGRIEKESLSATSVKDVSSNSKTAQNSQTDKSIETEDTPGTSEVNSNSDDDQNRSKSIVEQDGQNSEKTRIGGKYTTNGDPIRDASLKETDRPAPSSNTATKPNQKKDPSIKETDENSRSANTTTKRNQKKDSSFKELGEPTQIPKSETNQGAEIDSNPPDTKLETETNATNRVKTKHKEKDKAKDKAKDKSSSSIGNNSTILSEEVSNLKPKPEKSETSEKVQTIAGSSHEDGDEANSKSKFDKVQGDSLSNYPAPQDEVTRSVEMGQTSSPSQVFTFDEPAYLSATSGNTSPDIPSNFGRFRSDRPSLANIYGDTEGRGQNGGRGGASGNDVIATDQSESGREDSAEEANSRFPRSKTRQRVYRENVPRNLRRLSSSTPVQQKETNSLPNGQRFTVLAITNGDLHIDGTDDDE